MQRWWLEHRQLCRRELLALLDSSECQDLSLQRLQLCLGEPKLLLLLLLRRPCCCRRCFAQGRKPRRRCMADLTLCGHHAGLLLLLLSRWASKASQVRLLPCRAAAARVWVLLHGAAAVTVRSAFHATNLV